ncbi:MAG: helix-turn-helix domain-containing protein [Thermoanaerobaculia bacterium]
MSTLPLHDDAEQGLYTPEEAAHYLRGVSTSTLAHWRSAGRGPRYLKVGGIIRYRREDLERFVSRNVVATADDPTAPSNLQPIGRRK